MQQGINVKSTYYSLGRSFAAIRLSTLIAGVFILSFSATLAHLVAKSPLWLTYDYEKLKVFPQKPAASR